MSVRVLLPAEIAEPLLKEGLCTTALTRRGAVADAALALTVTGIAGNISAVIVAAPAVRSFAEGLLRTAWKRRPGPCGSSVSLSLKRSDGAQVTLDVSGVEDRRAIEIVILALRGPDGEA